MPRGVYQRDNARPKPRPVPLPVPSMPARKGRWRAATERAWASWFESGRASLLDEAGLAGLGRLMILIDRAESSEWPVGLAREVRLTEAAILRAANASPASVERPPTKPERREGQRAARARHMFRRRAECERLGIDEQELAGRELDALQPRQETTA
jgi:hypothetical protein